MKINSEYNNTKKMLKTIRNIISENKKVINILSEQETEKKNKNKSTEKTIDSVKVKLLSPDGIGKFTLGNNEEIIINLIESFETEISSLIDFTPGFIIDKNDIRLIGIIEGFTFLYSCSNSQEETKTENGLYIKCDTTLLTSEKIEILDKLQKKSESVIKIFADILESRI